MLDVIPARVWLLLLLGLIAWYPAAYIVRHLTHSPSRRDITQPAEDLGWRSSATLWKNATILAGLAALAIFIFTPAAADFAQSPSFAPVLMFAFGGFALWSTVSGYLTGRVEPIVRGVRWQFSREEHPRRYWASIGWNGLLGGAMTFFGIQQLRDAPVEALWSRCEDRREVTPPRDVVAACNQLLATSPDGDRARMIAARATARFRMDDYAGAKADFGTAARLDPAADAYRYNVGLTRERLGDRQGAIGDYTAAIARNHDNAAAFANRGLIHLDTRRYDQAIADFTRAYELRPADVMMRANRGVAYAWKNERAAAERDLAAVRKIEPGNVVVLHGEAILALNQGDLNRAMALLNQAISRDPADAWALSTRARLRESLGQQENVTADRDPALRVRQHRGAR